MVYANPYVACEQCGCRTVDRVVNANLPCGHRADFASVCPSWSPVDGCQCMEILGSRDHGDPALPPS